jgi:hypothetical protein
VHFGDAAGANEEISRESEYGHTQQTQAASVAAATIYAGDFDGDEHVDVEDLLSLVASFGACQGDASYDYRCDLDNSGCVDVIDLLYFVADFGV